MWHVYFYFTPISLTITLSNNCINFNNNNKVWNNFVLHSLGNQVAVLIKSKAASVVCPVFVLLAFENPSCYWFFVLDMFVLKVKKYSTPPQTKDVNNKVGIWISNLLRYLHGQKQVGCQQVLYLNAIWMLDSPAIWATVLYLSIWIDNKTIVWDSSV